MLAIGWADYKAMFAGLFTSTLSFAFAKILQQDVLGNLNGFFSYNAVLHAVVSVGYLPTIYESISLYEPRFWFFLSFATLISVYFTSAFANLFRYLWHYPIPCFTIPFNVLQYVLIFCLLNNSVPPKLLSSHLLEPGLKPNVTQLNKTAKLNETHFFPFDPNEVSRRRRETEDGIKNDDNYTKWLKDDSDFADLIPPPPGPEGNHRSNDSHLNWGETFSGTITALSQVYGLNNIPCSILMYLALLVYSPTTALFCYLGSFLGTLTGIFFSPDFEKVYAGFWGYNGLLCGGALAGFGFVLTPQSAFLAFVAILFSTVFQHFITPMFNAMDVPIFHIPFIFTTVIFLLVTGEYEKTLPRPGIYSYPEKHREEFKNQRENRFDGYLSRTGVSENF
ncbi:urea transporter, putative [Pediculus humanus corporis]|uniref:Urea transporter, putative n=1 Tax=Pediculus humanus subsp. corporis TaxID=121224 RepID=E0VD33_PEDHC|nr:urea transporter, putative [Pediculus humanus corporis]EEB11289.1 urea transporter, putative [Pediculus humanus corporis]